jgi:hypothetical protein
LEAEMSASLVATEAHRTRGSAVTLIVAAFAVGALMGVGIQGALDRASGSPTGGPEFQGVAENNMSDAARHAVYGTRGPGPFKGVADNNMSDAANAAAHAATR